MAQHSPSLCEYVVIRVAPDPIRHESVAIGVALYQTQAAGFADVRINSDWRRVRQLAPLFEFADLAGLEDDLRKHLRTASPLWFSREYLLQMAQESFSHGLEISAPTAVLAGDPAAELDALYRQFAATIERGSLSAARGPRRRILQHLLHVFRQERVPHLPAIYARHWLGGPDKFRFDFHYLDRGQDPHCIQALAVGEDETAVKELCFTMDRLHRKFARFDVAAFAEAAAAPGDAETYHRELLEHAGVRLLMLDQAAAEAARIRAALGLS